MGDVCNTVNNKKEMCVEHLTTIQTGCYYTPPPSSFPLRRSQICLKKLDRDLVQYLKKAVNLIRMVYMLIYADFIFFMAKTQNIRETR